MSAYNVGDPGSIPELGRPPGEGNDNPLQYSCLEKSPGWRSLVGYSPWGRKESDTTEQLHFYFQGSGLRSRHLTWNTSRGLLKYSPKMGASCYYWYLCVIPLLCSNWLAPPRKELIPLFNTPGFCGHCPGDSSRSPSLGGQWSLCSWVPQDCNKWRKSP